jgi:hypothetical protein
MSPKKVEFVISSGYPTTMRLLEDDKDSGLSLRQLQPCPQFIFESSENMDADYVPLVGKTVNSLSEGIKVVMETKGLLYYQSLMPPGIRIRSEE